jgi:beta-mannan synthase
MDRVSSASNIFPTGRDDITGQFGLIWQVLKEPLIVPALKLLVVVCLGMSIMLFIERVYMGIVIVFVKLFGKKPNKMYKWEPMKDDIEVGNSAYPMVLVQIPMYNEKEVLFFSLNYCFLFMVLLYSNLYCSIVFRFISCPLELPVGFHGRLTGS